MSLTLNSMFKKQFLLYGAPISRCGGIAREINFLSPAHPLIIMITPINEIITIYATVPISNELHKHVVDFLSHMTNIVLKSVVSLNLLTGD